MPSRDEIKKKVIEVVAERLKTDAANLSEEKSFDELGADSLEIVELVMTLEEEFGIEIQEQDADNIRTVGDAIDFIEKSLG
jgi:acyl carrier protein